MENRAIVGLILSNIVQKSPFNVIIWKMLFLLLAHSDRLSDGNFISFIISQIKKTYFSH